MGKAHNGQPSRAAYAHSRTFFRRIKHLIQRDFFVSEFEEAMREEDIGYTFGPNGLTFHENKRPPKPSYEQLEAEIAQLKERLGDVT